MIVVTQRENTSILIDDGSVIPLESRARFAPGISSNVAQGDDDMSQDSDNIELLR